MKYENKKFLVIDAQGQIVYGSDQRARISTYMISKRGERVLRVFERRTGANGSSAMFYALHSVYGGEKFIEIICDHAFEDSLLVVPQGAQDMAS